MSICKKLPQDKCISPCIFINKTRKYCKMRTKRKMRSKSKSSSSVLKQFRLVIARFSEDISWLNKPELKVFPKTIYNKGPELKGFKSIQIPNVGREAQTFIYHIIKNYDNLDDITIFLPGSCMDVSKINKTNETLSLAVSTEDSVFVGIEYPDVVKKFGQITKSEWIGTNAENIALLPTAKVAPAEYRPYKKWYDHYIGKDVLTKLVSWTAIFAVSRKHILQRPREFYIAINECLNKHSNPEEGHFMEMTWTTLFGHIPEKNLYSLWRVTQMQPLKLIFPYIPPPVAIIVPFDKTVMSTDYIGRFYSYMKEYLKGAEYRIFIVEQTTGAYNRGRLLNIGFDISSKAGYIYYIFHNINLLPTERLLRSYVKYRDIISHLANVLKLQKRINNLGAVISFSKPVFEQINGYSNMFEGCSGEDEDIEERITASKYYLTYPRKGDYQIIGLLNPVKKCGKVISNKSSGLSDLKYSIIETKPIGKECSVFSIV